ncbi:MAG TPA: hypothetical protein VE825_10880 [Terriglobales bacterium]|jgi:hypothetical protein|nr:hypothetical protein [Terriglobales bacterium]
MPSNPPSPGSPRKISRRRFAREAALAGATAALLPSSALAQGTERAEPVPPSLAADYAKLPPSSQAEVDSKYRAVLRRYGARFTAAQKTEARRQLIATQKALDSLRAFSLENSDPPATSFRVSRRPPGPARQPGPRAGKP